LLLRIAARSLPLDKVEREWDAQITKIKSAGISPTHLDGHKRAYASGFISGGAAASSKHGIPAIRIAHEESRLRSALSSVGELKTSVLLSRGCKPRVETAGARCREMAERAGISRGLFLRIGRPGC